MPCNALVFNYAHLIHLIAVKAAALHRCRPIADNSADSNLLCNGVAPSSSSSLGSSSLFGDEWQVNGEAMAPSTLSSLPLSQVQSREEAVVDITLPLSDKGFDVSLGELNEDDAADTTPSLLERMASVRGMHSILKLAKDRTKLRRGHPPAWIDDAERYLSLPGFEQVLVQNRHCVDLILQVLELGDSGEPKAEKASDEALEDPQGVLVVALTSLFRGTTDMKLRCTALENGTVDCVLLRLGVLQAEKPRDSSRVAKFLTDRERGHLLSNDASAKTKDETGGKMEEKKQLWAPGFGFGDHDTAVEDLERQRKMKKKRAETLNVLECLTAILSTLGQSAADVPAAAVQELKAALLTSCFLRAVLSFLFGNTFKDLLDNVNLYKTLFGLILAISRIPELAEIFVKVSGVYKSVNELVVAVHQLIQVRQILSPDQ